LNNTYIDGVVKELIVQLFPNLSNSTIDEEEEVDNLESGLLSASKRKNK
jgi:hypothetical protein